MRYYIALASVLVSVAGTAVAATGPDKNLKPAASHHVVHKAKAKTTGHPLGSSLSDPNAGVTEDGTANTTVTNGGELAH